MKLTRALHIATNPRRSMRHLTTKVIDAFGPQAAFEIRSWLGRRAAHKLELDRDARNYINLGSGGDAFDGFINVDFFGTPTAYGADLRYPLAIDDATVDGIFSEHTLEHLDYDEVARLLKECARIMKPGGRIRIVLPDLSLFAQSYAAKNADWFKVWEDLVLGPRRRAMISPVAAISFVTQEYGHRSAWDSDTLQQFLEAAGFVAVQRYAFGEGADPRLLQDCPAPDRTWVSLYIEASKPALSVHLPGAPGESHE